MFVNFPKEETSNLFRSWNTTVKMIWNVPRATHSYFVDNLLNCGYKSIKSLIMKKFVKFFHQLMKSNNPVIRVIAQLSARDRRSILGRNLFFIRDLTDLNPWNNTASTIRQSIPAIMTPINDVWRLEYLTKLLSERVVVESNFENIDHIQGLIDSLCIS